MTEYEVLYYKRKNKVHKSKGVSKLDGFLKQGQGSFSLMDENRSILLTHPDTVKRALQPDETIALGSFDVEILASSEATSVQKSVLVRKRPLSSVGAASTSAVGGSSSLRLAQENRPNKTAKPLQQPTIRKPPIQPKKNIAVQSHKAVSSVHPPLVPAQPSVQQQLLPQRTVRKVQKIQMPRKVHTGEANANATIHHTILPHIPLPATLARVLRPHQVSGVDFLWKAVAEGGAILADEMGCGKTLMTIAVICALHRQDRSNQFLVVCPSSLVTNWAREFDKWIGKAGQPKRVVIDKNDKQQGQQQMRAYVSCMKRQNGQVLILSYDIFRRNSGLFDNQSFGLLVADESHRLKNTNGSLTLSALESVQAIARLCITATPIQNNLGEFFTIASFCRPGVFGDLATFRQEYERPILAANNKSASHREKSRAKECSQALDAITKTFMLRRLQKDILKTMLPPRTEVLLFCQPTQQQCTLYRSIAKVEDGDALSALTSLRKVCLHPALIDERYDGGLGLSGKLVVLKELLCSIRKNAPNDKVVVVSNFTSALSLIETLLLQPSKLSYLRLDGSTDVQNRQTLVESFNRTSSDHSFCFLLSSKAGGIGLNLIGANRLIMVDPDYNPANDIQAMGRIYRQGQNKPTTIYRLFTSGTVEEVIYQRQLQKGNLATLAVDSAEKTSSHFSKEELKDCFTLKEHCVCDTKRKMGARWIDYEGPESLDGCDDEPLLEMASAECTALNYVHVVEDSETFSTTDGGSSNDPLSQRSLYDSCNEEEAEFSDSNPAPDLHTNTAQPMKSLYDSDDEEEAEF